MKISSSAVVIFVVLYCCGSLFAQTRRPSIDQQKIHAPGNSVQNRNTILVNKPEAIDSSVVKTHKVVDSVIAIKTQHTISTTLIQPTSRDKGQTQILRNPIGSIKKQRALLPSTGLMQRNLENAEKGKIKEVKDKIISKTDAPLLNNSAATVIEIPETKALEIKSETLEIENKVVSIVAEGTVPLPYITEKIIKTEAVKTVGEINATMEPAIIARDKIEVEPIKAEILKVEKTVTPIIANATVPAPVYTEEILKTEPLKVVEEINSTLELVVAAREKIEVEPIKAEIEKIEKTVTPIITNANVPKLVYASEISKVNPIKIVEVDKFPSQPIVSEEKKENQKIKKEVIVPITKHKIVNKDTILWDQNRTIVTAKSTNNATKTSEKIASITARDIAPGYYLVTKVFDNETYSIMWQRRLNQEGYSARTLVNSETKKFYIYIESSKIIEMMLERKETVKRIKGMAESKVYRVNL